MQNPPTPNSSGAGFKVEEPSHSQHFHLMSEWESEAHRYTHSYAWLAGCLGSYVGDLLSQKTVTSTTSEMENRSQTQTHELMKGYELKG